MALALVFAAALAAQRIDGPFVLLIGPPGSGKSTQASLVAERLGVPLVSVEELIANNPEVFEKIRASGLSGMEPRSDPVINRLLEKRLKQGDLTQGAVLDGYPVTKDHCDFLAKLVEHGTLPNPFILELTVPDQIVRERLAGESGQTSASVEQRLKDYRREMSGFRFYFPTADLVVVDGAKTPEEVAEEIRFLLARRFRK